MSRRGEWVSHPRHGWIHDRTPLVEIEGYLAELCSEVEADDDSSDVAFIRLVEFGDMAERYFVNIKYESGATSWVPVPLTTAARDLLAALKQEAE